MTIMFFDPYFFEQGAKFSAYTTVVLSPFGLTLSEESPIVLTNGSP
ncbi:hypothetical protein [Angelakisella massiliensis]|nr:hypothetical protein [Angelakisella massiliensis]